MAQTLNIEKLERKFSSVSKESRQMLSLWIMHQKQFSDDICRYWLKKIITSDSSHRLTLFFIANDVLQQCKEKNASEYLVAFSNVLENAVSLVKGDVIEDDIIHMIKTWHEKHLFETNYLVQLLKVCNAEASLVDKSEMELDKKESLGIEAYKDIESVTIADFKPKMLISSLQHMMKQKAEVHHYKRRLKSVPELMASIKQSGHGSSSSSSKVEKNINAAYKILENYITAAEENIAIKKNVLKLIETASVFYTQQNNEFKHVAHAYRIFGKKLKLMKQKIDRKLNSFPEAVETIVEAEASPFSDTNKPELAETTDRDNESTVDSESASPPNKISKDIDFLSVIMPLGQSMPNRKMTMPSEETTTPSPEQTALPSAQALSLGQSPILPLEQTILSLLEQATCPLKQTTPSPAKQIISSPAKQIISSPVEQTSASPVKQMISSPVEKMASTSQQPEEQTMTQSSDIASSGTKSFSGETSTGTDIISSEHQTDISQKSIRCPSSSQLNLLKSMTLLQKLMPSSTAREVDESASVPLSVICHVITKGSYSLEHETNSVLNKLPNRNDSDHQQNDFSSTDMDIDSDENSNTNVTPITYV